ncbi:predicted protein [Nematostella vectensis]|uniref:Uncharacterized protein n=1 Tax=Nematostella vectensis TaxID=45351 RepID=A7T7I5_NEMVE|nr:predicted protein [Nematostella vectensis]|eukprot:XP_001620166.1 hypothetical protein NEMVEDRAFT_v1g223390 [Nematostella vectensis]
MAADLADRSFSLLPSVFELLLHNADNIIDDTSIEKLLTWLGEVSSQRNSLEALLSGETGAREFLHSDKLFESSTSLAFALRLCGLLWRHEECFEDLESMLGLFKKSTLDSNGRMSEKSKLNVLIKVIGAVEGLASKAPQACPVSTSKWSKYSLAVLANCALGDVPNEEYVLPPGLQGDLKLLKASLSAALSLIKVQVMVQGNANW